QIALLSELLPRRVTLALLIDPQMPETVSQLAGAEKAEVALGHQPLVVRATSDSELEAAFAQITGKKAGALLVGSSPFLLTRTRYLVEQVARHAIPTMSFGREPVEAGGLVS